MRRPSLAIRLFRNWFSTLLGLGLIALAVWLYAWPDDPSNPATKTTLSFWEFMGVLVFGGSLIYLPGDQLFRSFLTALQYLISHRGGPPPPTGGYAGQSDPFGQSAPPGPPGNPPAARMGLALTITVCVCIAGLTAGCDASRRIARSQRDSTATHVTVEQRTESRLSERLSVSLSTLPAFDLRIAKPTDTTATFAYHETSGAFITFKPQGDSITATVRLPQVLLYQSQREAEYKSAYRSDSNHVALASKTIDRQTETDVSGFSMWVYVLLVSGFLVLILFLVHKFVKPFRPLI